MTFGAQFGGNQQILNNWLQQNPQPMDTQGMQGMNPWNSFTGPGSIAFQAALGNLLPNQQQGTPLDWYRTVTNPMNLGDATGASYFNALANMHSANMGYRTAEGQALWGRQNLLDQLGLGQYQTDVQSGDFRYGADRGLEGVQAQADAQRHGADRGLEGVLAQAGAARHGSDQTLRGVIEQALAQRHGADVGGRASEFGSLAGLLGAQHTADRGLEGTLQQSADRRAVDEFLGMLGLRGTQEQTSAQRDVARMGAQSSQFGTMGDVIRTLLESQASQNIAQTQNLQHTLRDQRARELAFPLIAPLVQRFFGGGQDA